MHPMISYIENEVLKIYRSTAKDTIIWIYLIPVILVVLSNLNAAFSNAWDKNPLIHISEIVCTSTLSRSSIDGLNVG